MDCILCNNKNLSDIDSYKKEDLKKLWNDVVDTSEELYKDTVDLYTCNNCSLEFFDTDLAGGDKFYSELGKLDWYYLHPGKTEYDYVQNYIEDGMKILDIGCGRGVLHSKITKKVDYQGLELSTKAVELAKKDNINVIQETIQNHANKNTEKYDLVCLFQVLEHLTELETFLKAIYQVLKPDGKFVIAVPNNNGFISKIANYTFNLPPHHTILWKEESLRFLAKKYSFDVVDVHEEELQDVHKVYAYKAQIQYELKKKDNYPLKWIDGSTKNVAFVEKANKLYKLYKSNFVYRYFKFRAIKNKSKTGQSIIITLKKK